MTEPPEPRDEDGWLERVFPLVEGGGPLRVGPGHDCAVVTIGGVDVVVTTDVLVDGVHFRIESCGPEAAGRKALLVNLSDLAAAGASPRGCEVGVVLPRDKAADWLPGLARGLGESARRYGCPVAGGDTNVATGPLVIAVTVFGEPGPGGFVTRSGAQPGDHLSVTGPLGGSVWGRHLDVRPRLEAGRRLADLGVAHAMMDLSDGLSRDLPRLCRASGVGARIDAASVPVHADVARHEDDVDPLRHALDDGEDFELLVAHAPLDADTRRALAQAGVDLIRIGEVRSIAEGITLRSSAGDERLEARGYDHFRGEDAGLISECRGACRAGPTIRVWMPRPTSFRLPAS